MGFGPGPEPVREWYGFRTIHRTDDVQFGDDPEHGFHNGGTVIYDALQWAVFMGYNPIGIVGVDLAWPDNPKAPTHARKFKGRKHDKFPPNTRYALQYFRYAAALLRHLNVEAFNLAPEGRGQLDVFPRLSLAAFADQ